MVLIKATKNGSDGVIINPPINIVNYKTYKNIFEYRLGLRRRNKNTANKDEIYRKHI